MLEASCFGEAYSHSEVDCDAVSELDTDSSERGTLRRIVEVLLGKVVGMVDQSLDIAVEEYNSDQVADTVAREARKQDEAAGESERKGAVWPGFAVDMSKGSECMVVEIQVVASQPVAQSMAVVRMLGMQYSRECMSMREE